MKSSEHKPGFDHAPSLRAIRSQGAERVAAREATGVNKAEVSAKEEAPLLVGGCNRECERIAAAAIAEQVQAGRGAPAAGYIFRPDCQRYSMLEIVVEQK